MTKTYYRYIALCARIEIAEQLKAKYLAYRDDQDLADDHFRPPNLDRLIAEQERELAHLKEQFAAMNWLYHLQGLKAPDYQAYKKGERVDYNRPGDSCD